MESLSMIVIEAMAIGTPCLVNTNCDVLKYYFGLDGNAAHTLEDISEKVGLTRERVRQIKEKALRRLRKSSKSKILKTYLG